MTLTPMNLTIQAKETKATAIVMVEESKVNTILLDILKKYPWVDKAIFEPISTRDTIHNIALELK